MSDAGTAAVPIDKPPERVVRFFGNTDYALETLAYKHITFVHASTLNDPFDPYFFLEIEFGDDYNAFYDYVKRTYPGKLRLFATHVTAASWKKTFHELEEHLQATKAGMFIFSTTGTQNDNHPKDNLYMWGHYGNGHRGIAIEFDTELLKQAVIKNTAKSLDVDYSEVWVKILYDEKFPPIIYGNLLEFFEQEWKIFYGRITKRRKTTLRKYYDTMSKIKSEVWAKENEWRLMWRNTETRMKIHGCPIPSTAVTQIFLGMAISDKVADDVVFESKQKTPSARIWRARKRFGEFALDFEQII